MPAILTKYTEPAGAAGLGRFCKLIHKSHVHVVHAVIYGQTIFFGRTLSVFELPGDFPGWKLLKPTCGRRSFPEGLFRASCPPPLRGRLRFASAFKIVPDNFVFRTILVLTLRACFARPNSLPANLSNLVRSESGKLSP